MNGTFWDYLNLGEIQMVIGRFMLIIWGSIGAIMLILAISTAIVASKKGRNGFGWFFIGLFTGIVGLAISLAILPKKYYIDEQEE
ncbi:MAG: hypothetical protein NTV78_00770 [Caldiserica bacterium]|nr:hypothetical protein [Caldisericota bacterium]